MKVHIIGIGLIGGSFALGLRREFLDVEITAIDTSRDHLQKAQSMKLIDRVGGTEEVQNADVVILAVPVDIAKDLILRVLDLAGADTLVFDTGSTKAGLCEIVADHQNRGNFLATHPIAGTEYSGPTAAVEDLFRNKTNIICEVEKTTYKLRERALQIFQKLGMHIRYMEANSHDRHIAYVSHLSHVTSFMLGKTVLEKEKDEKDIFDLAGSGFASTVRLAKSSPAMWTPIFLENKKNILESLEEYIANLAEFKTLIEMEAFEKIFQEMESVNHIQNVLKQYLINRKPGN